MVINRAGLPLSLKIGGDSSALSVHFGRPRKRRRENVGLFWQQSFSLPRAQRASERGAECVCVGGKRGKKASARPGRPPGAAWERGSVLPAVPDTPRGGGAPPEPKTLSEPRPHGRFGRSVVNIPSEMHTTIVQILKLRPKRNPRPREAI